MRILCDVRLFGRSLLLVQHDAPVGMSLECHKREVVFWLWRFPLIIS